MTKNTPVSQDAMNLLFLEARTFNGWQSKDVPDDILKNVFDLAKMGRRQQLFPDARCVCEVQRRRRKNCAPCLNKGNVDKTMAAPVTALFAYDLNFYDHLPKLFPHADARSWYAGRDAVILDTAQRNGTLQAAYYMIAARAVGLDCGPMSGFDKAKVKDAFFPDLNGEVNFICNLGYGDESSLYPRSPRFEFSDVNKIV